MSLSPERRQLLDQLIMQVRQSDAARDALEASPIMDLMTGYVELHTQELLDLEPDEHEKRLACTTVMKVCRLLLADLRDMAGRVDDSHREEVQRLLAEDGDDA